MAHVRRGLQRVCAERPRRARQSLISKNVRAGEEWFSTDLFLLIEGSKFAFKTCIRLTLSQPSVDHIS